MSCTPTAQQQQCIEALSTADMLKIEACAGSGKEQPLDTIVQTPDGPRQFGSLKIGDKVFGSNGKPTEVIGVYPQGLKPAYKVTFRDGSYTRCGLEHNWSVKNFKKYVTRTLQEILEMGVLKNSGDFKFQVPLAQPVEYTGCGELPIPAYTLGVIIGDGSLCQSTPQVSVADRDIKILEKIMEENPSARFNGKRTGANCMQYTISEGDGGNKASANTFKNRVKSLGLDVLSREKFIPAKYLLASVEDRKNLLGGLMDTDGSSSKGRTSFSTCSPALANDVKSLVQSLGGTAIVRKPNNRDGEISVNIKTMFNPFISAEFKKSQWVLSSKNPPSRYIASVEYVGDVEQMCIKVAAEDSLYLTDEFIVTHNTSTLTMMAASYVEPSLYLAFNKVTATEAAEKFPSHVTCRTTHSMAYSAFGAKLREKLSRPKGRYVNVAGTGSEVARYFGVNAFESKEGVTISANFIGLLAKNTVALFEQSADPVIAMKHVPTSDLRDKLTQDTQAIEYVKGKILTVAVNLWNERINLKSPVLATHDTYLKQFQLSKPVFSGFKVVYVDEFQDTTPCVLDIVLNQKNHMKVVMVGDARQAIYGWRGAINAMQMVNCEARYLTKSFRYGQAVADIATMVLEGSMRITGNENINSVAKSCGIIDVEQPYTRLFRTNSALLSAAIGEIRKGTEVAIEIDVKDFVKVLQSGVALFEGSMKDVKHEKLIPYTTWDEMLAEAKDDAELGRVAKVIKEGLAHQWISVLESHQNSRNPHVTFTTAHKSKGREWSQVRIESDFKSCYDEDGEWIGLTVEEQNLLYVAATRAIDKLEYNLTVGEYISAWESEETQDEVKYKAYVKQSVKTLNNDVYEALAA